MTHAKHQHETFRAERIAEVTGDHGALTLVRTQWDQPGVPQADELTVLADYPDTSTLSRLAREHVETGEEQFGYRIWQSDSPARQAFEGIDAYPFDPAWIVAGRFEFVDADRTVPFEHIRDGGATRNWAVSGDLVFAHNGTEYRVEALDTELPSGPGLQLVFGDQTNGADTYGAGRFLYVELPKPVAEMRAGDTVEVTLDFNRAEVPPCGFSSQMNCPLPPLQNRLPFPVTAGEKKVLFASGFDLI